MSDNEISIRAIVKTVLEVQSPIEAELVDTYDPTMESHGITSKGPSGFGGTHEMILLLPFVWEIVDAFFKEASKQAMAELVKQLKDYLIRAVEGSAAREERAANAVSLIATALQAKGIEAQQSRAVAVTVWKVLLESRSILSL